FHDLIAGVRLGRQAASTQAKFATGLRVGRDLQLHRATQGRHADSRAQRGLPGSDRQDVNHVAPIHLELRMSRIFDLQQQCTTVAALPTQPDRLPLTDAFGNPHLQSLAIDSDPYAVTGIHRLQRYRELGPGIGTGICPGAGTKPTVRSAVTTLPRRAASSPEKRLEEIAEPTTRATTGEDLLEIHPVTALPAKATGRLVDLIAGAIPAGAKLIISRPFLGVAQCLISLVDGLEWLLRARLLAYVRMVLA